MLHSSCVAILRFLHIVYYNNNIIYYYVHIIKVHDPTLYQLYSESFDSSKAMTSNRLEGIEHISIMLVLLLCLKIFTVSKKTVKASCTNAPMYYTPSQKIILF